MEYLLRTEIGYKVGEMIESADTDWHVPALCDVEVVSALKKMTGRVISEERAGQAISDMLAFPLTRHTHESLVLRAYNIRHNLSIYDGVYVALAELLDTKLVTGDRAMARAARIQERIIAF